MHLPSSGSTFKNIIRTNDVQETKLKQAPFVMSIEFFTFWINHTLEYIFWMVKTTTKTLIWRRGGKLVCLAVLRTAREVSILASVWSSTIHHCPSSHTNQSAIPTHIPVCFYNFYPLTITNKCLGLVHIKDNKSN